MTLRKHMLDDLDQEIRDHIQRETQNNIECGMSPEEAHYAAMRKFGNVTRIKEETRAVWSFVWREQLVQDVRFGFRMSTVRVGTSDATLPTYSAPPAPRPPPPPQSPLPPLTLNPLM